MREEGIGEKQEGGGEEGCCEWLVPHVCACRKNREPLPLPSKHLEEKTTAPVFPKKMNARALCHVLTTT